MADPKLSRRDLLAAGGALLAAGAAPRLARAFPPHWVPPTWYLKKAVKYEMIAGEDLSVYERFRIAHFVGLDGVEMPSPADLDLDEVVAARDRAKIVIHGVVDTEHWRSPLSDPDPEVRARGLAALETALRDCKRYGGTTVLLVPGVVNERVDYADAYERSQLEIRKVLPLAEELEVKIAIENVWNDFLLSPLEAARYVDEFESPWVGWYLDIGNVVRYGWPEQWIRALGTRILKVDVKDYSRAKRDGEGLWKGFDVELGEGDVDWKVVRKALDRIKFDRWATAEVPGGDALRLKAIADAVDLLLRGKERP